MNITGKIMIFKNNFGFYEGTISNKKQDNTYENMYVSINFNKCEAPENKTLINVTDGFIGFYKTKEGLPKPKFIISNYEIINNKQDNNYIPNDEEQNPFEITSDDTLPF